MVMNEPKLWRCSIIRSGPRLVTSKKTERAIIREIPRTRSEPNNMTTSTVSSVIFRKEEQL